MESQKTNWEFVGQIVSNFMLSYFSYFIHFAIFVKVADFS